MMSGFESEFAARPVHPLAGGLVQLRIAHDAALADLALAHFKLRFDQYNHLPAGPEQRNRGGQDQRHRDEADVAGDQVAPARRCRRASARAR